MKICSFLKGLVKFKEIGNFEDLVLGVKFEFKVKNWYMHTKKLPNNLGCHCGVGQLSGGTYIHTYIHTYNLYLNTIKISKLTSLWGRVLNKIHKKLELKIKIILIKYNFDKNK